MYKHFFKRVLDFLISGIALLLISWLLIIITIFLHFANKGAGAFFFQERIEKMMVSYFAPAVSIAIFISGCLKC